MKTDFKKSIFDHILLTTGYYLPTEKLEEICTNIVQQVDKGESFFDLLYQLEQSNDLKKYFKKSEGAFDVSNTRGRSGKTKKIIQKNIDGSFVQCFDSITEASLAFGSKTPKNNIYDCANGKTKTAYGYKWEWGSD